ncbi:flagellar hook-associated protein 1 FlgK [Clostridium cavendishii DSM 21758]|uniref:Flagellar hook-associated protein 1 n=1 Tax=Clostridium cavendishii DSM 21758 TaxID=1121302 RepID=A0A1M6B3E6_9CLOT|nr:flagellar hook-associated protein FlgK [Clostridium cavendishii]SHI43128.1 flagellar hook-associated protein 1 FlgK [Clostridium cavendishii DSM 21758]
MSGLFATLNIGKSGLYTAQKSIDVTSHNISNANTEGYSKQRANAVTNAPYTVVGSAGQVGTGSQIQSIERIRDSFLDYQVRNQTAVLGQYDTRSSYLSQIEGILNEPSDTGISTLMGKFFDSWQELSKQPQSSNNRTVVAQQTLALTDALNNTYRRFDDLQKDAQSMIQNSVIDINSSLDQINELNQEIMSVKVSGNQPNDLMDKRDLLLDKLSSNFNIVVDKKNFEGIDLRPTDTTGMISPNLVQADGNSDYTRFSYINNIEKQSDGSYKVTYYALGNMASDKNKKTLILEDATEDQINQLQQGRVLWGDKNGIAIKGDGAEINDGDTIKFSQLRAFTPQSGSLKGNSSIQEDIGKYKEQLNNVAKAIAFTVNAIHSGKQDAADDKLPFFVNGKTATYNDASELDLSSNNENEITAENISINKEILSDVMKIKTKTHDDQYDLPSQNTQDGDKDNARAVAIAQLRNGLIKIQNIDSTSTRATIAPLDSSNLNVKNDINGTTLDGYFKDTVDRLGIQAQEAKRNVDNQTYLLDDINNSKESVSGVSLDEEMANLVQFQHAYGANAKVISTVDQLLDVVVNGLKK